MSRDSAKAHYSKQPGDPDEGYITASDAQAAIDDIYDDMSAPAVIADGSVTSGKIAADAVGSAQIATGAVGSGELATDAVTSDKIADGAVSNAHVASDAAIAASKVAGTAVTQADTGTVTNGMLAGSIAKTKVAGTAITAADTGTVTGTMIGTGEVGNGNLAANAVNEAKIASGAVTTVKIEDDAVTTAKIAADAVTSAEIAANAVGASELADNAVDTAAIAADAVGTSELADGAVTPEKLSTDVGAATLEVGTVTTGSADVAISGNVDDGYTLDFVLPAVAGISIDPDNANAMIAGGVDNTINKVASRATNPMSAHVEGNSTEAQGWYGHAEGAGSLAEGKISHAEGNKTICAANDSHAEGNMTATGRRQYLVESTGSEDAGDSLGVLQFVVLPATEGDVTSFFPNPLTDDVTGRYGAGAQLDVKGNVYASGHTPAVWTGNVPTTVNDLQWAMHSVMLLRDTSESKPVFASIAKAVYAGSKTKVYYLGAKPFATIGYVYGAYSPAVLGGGNGQHAEGNQTSTSGYSAHAEGYITKAWGLGAHAEGRQTKAAADYGPHAEGYLTAASGYSAHAEGKSTIASGANSHAEGDTTTASGTGSHAENVSTVASGPGSHAEGGATTASGDYSHSEGINTLASGYAAIASGYKSVASRSYQSAHSVGERVTAGDSQISRIGYSRSCANAGWHDVHVFNTVENNRTYLWETTVIGRQTAGTAGAVGNTFAYKFTGAVSIDGSGAGTTLGTITRVLIGRTAGMTGDGLSTGPRMSELDGAALYISDIALRFDGEADTTFYIAAYSTVQELA